LEEPESNLKKYNTVFPAVATNKILTKLHITSTKSDR